MSKFDIFLTCMSVYFSNVLYFIFFSIVNIVG